MSRTVIVLGATLLLCSWGLAGAAPPEGPSPSAYVELVAGPNALVAGDDGLTHPDRWDHPWAGKVLQTARELAATPEFLEDLERIRSEYAHVASRAADRGLPEVVAAIPYLVSEYRADHQIGPCAKGYWRLMPEAAHRIGEQSDVPLAVRDCRLAHAPDVLWSPTRLTPGRTVDLPYVQDGECSIQSCAVDGRTDLEISTDGALWMLDEAWQDAEFRASGAAVQLLLASYVVGYDESRFGEPQRFNVKPAFERWRKRTESPTALFAGEALTTEDAETHQLNGSVLVPEAQHFGYRVVGHHMVASCYYAAHPAGQAVFEQWAPRLTTWCSALSLPGEG